MNNGYRKFRSLFLGNSAENSSSVSLKEKFLSKKYLYVIFSIIFLFVNWKLFVAVLLTIFVAVFVNNNIIKIKGKIRNYEGEYYENKKNSNNQCNTGEIR